MQRYEKEGVEWLQFDLLSGFPRLQHAVFLRQGGFSESPYDGLNCSLFVGDQPEHVRKNIHLMESFFRGRSVWGRGVHKAKVSVVDEDSPEEILDCDGLATSHAGVALFMKHADCQVALIYDPKKHVIANVHAGWRGSVLNIYGEAVNLLKDRYGSHPADLLACIGPSLGPDEAEFYNYRIELPEELWSFQVRPSHFNFWEISEYQLESAGVLPHHIEIARLSTYANSRDFFSYRRDKVTGRHATGVMLL